MSFAIIRINHILKYTKLEKVILNGILMVYYYFYQLYASEDKRLQKTFQVHVLYFLYKKNMKKINNLFAYNSKKKYF